MQETIPKTVRYLHFPIANITIKFVHENGQWVCRTNDEFLDDADKRMIAIQDELK